MKGERGKRNIMTEETEISSRSSGSTFETSGKVCLCAANYDRSASACARVRCSCACKAGWVNEHKIGGDRSRKKIERKALRCVLRDGIFFFFFLSGRVDEPSLLRSHREIAVRAVDPEEGVKGLNV